MEEDTAPFMPQPPIPLSAMGLNVMGGFLNPTGQPTLVLCSSVAGVKVMIIDPEGETDEGGVRHIKVLAEVVFPTPFLRPLMYLISNAYTAHVKIVAANN